MLETDAPYIVPSWRRTPEGAGRTEPADLARIAAEVAVLRGQPVDELAQQGRANASAALPRLAALLDRVPDTC